MANEIPSSAIKFYDAPSGGNQVTSGIAGSKTVYGRITEPFSEGLTGQSLYTGFPYYGRSALSGTKNFICGSDVETFTLTLPAFGNISNALDPGAEEEISFTGGEALWDSGNVGLTPNSGNFNLTFFLNTASAKVSISGLEGSITSILIDGDSATNGVAKSINGDTGRVSKYPVDISLAITENTTINSRGVAIISINDNLNIEVYQNGGSSNMSLSVNSASVDNATGLSSTAIEITANDNWTV